MLIILSTCFVVLMVSLIFSGILGESTHKRLLIVFSFFLILFLYYFKNNEIFPDLIAYFSLFEDSQQVSFDEIDKLQKFRWFYKFEFCWCLLTKILSSITSNKDVIIVVPAIIVLVGYLTFIKKYSKMVAFSIMLFLVMFFYNSCFVLRQNIAVAVCLISISFAINRKIYFFLIFVIFASSLHSSAIFFIPLYWLCTIKLTKKYILTFLLVSVVVSLISYTLVSYISWLASYSFYVDRISHGSWNDAANGTPLIISLAVLLFVSHYVDFNKLENVNLFGTHALLIACALNLCRLGMPGVVGRMTLYFLAPLCVLLPNVCDSIDNKYIKFGACCLIFFFYSLLCFNSLNYGFQLTLF